MHPDEQKIQASRIGYKIMERYISEDLAYYKASLNGMYDHLDKLNTVICELRAQNAKLQLANQQLQDNLAKLENPVVTHFQIGGCLTS